MINLLTNFLMLTFGMIVGASMTYVSCVSRMAAHLE